jgi:hypothetical protein
MYDTVCEARVGTATGRTSAETFKNKITCTHECMFLSLYYNPSSLSEEVTTDNADPHREKAKGRNLSLETRKILKTMGNLDNTATDAPSQFPCKSLTISTFA